MTQKTVRVRIAVVMQPDGVWAAEGCSYTADEYVSQHLKACLLTPPTSEDALHWVEADIPLPTSVTVEGEVVT